MGNENDRNVYKRKDGWADKRQGASRPAEIYRTQGEAKQAAVQRAKRSGGDVNIHGRDGKIREKNTYGKPDPLPPRDKR